MDKEDDKKIGARYYIKLEGEKTIKAMFKNKWQKALLAVVLIISTVLFCYDGPDWAASLSFIILSVLLYIRLLIKDLQALIVYTDMKVVMGHEVSGFTYE